MAELRQLQAEYEAWRDGLPEGLADSKTGQLLEGVCEVGEAEYRLSNGEGASLLLRCERGVVSAGFEFPGPVNATGRAFLRAIPGERRNVAVKPVGERLLQLTGGGGLDAFLRLLSLSTTANLQVRAGGEQASFTVFGSDLIREAFWGQVSGGATGRPTPRKSPYRPSSRADSAASGPGIPPPPPNRSESPVRALQVPRVLSPGPRSLVQHKAAMEAIVPATGSDRYVRAWEATITCGQEPGRPS